MQSLIHTIIGAVAGAGCSLTGGVIIKFLSEKRGLETEISRIMRIFELTVGTVFGILIILFNPSLVSACYAFLLLILAEVSAVMDIEHRIIPNEVIVSALIVKIIFIIFSVIGIKGAPEFGILSSLTGFAACFAIFLLPSFFGKNVGAGDVKLAAAMGFCLGFKGSLAAVVFMGLLIMVYVLVKPRVPVMTALKKTIPMGPFLSLGMMAVCIFAGYGLI